MTKIDIPSIFKVSKKPVYSSALASGADLFADIETPIILKPLERILVPTGLSIALPPGYEAQVRPRSGLAIKRGITCLNTPGTIDADYRGEIKVIIVNLSNSDVEILPNERIAQLVVAPVVQANFNLTDDLTKTSRGEGGFGSTGV